jgi:3-hydroxy-3-methylglutaryl CoA synthase/uncharacterized OB-fold protein
MGVEAARRALQDAGSLQGLVFSTAQPAYLDKTNATAVHAALCLPDHVPAYDMNGSVRSAVGALRSAADSAAAGRPTLAVLSELRTGLSGSVDEAYSGDGSAAFVLGTENTLADIVAVASTSAEFLERWRAPEASHSQVWEERFGETAYVPLAEASVTEACKKAGITLEDVDHKLVVGLQGRANASVARTLGAAASDLGASVGNLGCAQPGIALADALDRAEPGDLILLVVLADGADALVLRATERLASYRALRPSLREQIAGNTMELDYAKFLTWRGYLRREPPRRPNPDRPAAPPAWRHEAWKFGFVGSRCTACETRHVPPVRVCVRCGATDEMTPERLADVPGRIATFTVDRLAYSLSPPAVVAVVDFDGGGRIQCELTDVDPDAVRIGDRVEMTFRRLLTADGVHNYFWKARPSHDTKDDK